MADYTVITRDEEQEADLDFDLAQMNQGKKPKDQITKAGLVQFVIDSHLASVRGGRRRTLEAAVLDSILKGQSGPEQDELIEKAKKAKGKQ